MEEASWALFALKFGPFAALLAGFCIWQLRDVNRSICAREARERESEAAALRADAAS